MNIIELTSGKVVDTDESIGQYEYLGHYLNKCGAKTELWQCLTRLYARIAELEAAQIQTETVLQRYIAKFGECGELHDLPPMPEVEA